ncbi:hypothetical protein LEP1GSC168_0820 [Leptospira santarosai str. HAI134]|nr:hypothetical protein LEP1GSC168_0820 [Leptospira santarosai str. HAI134]
MIVLIRNPITYDSKIPCGIEPERIHNYLSDFGRKPRINGTKLRTYETIENTIRNNSLSRTTRKQKHSRKVGGRKKKRD